MIVLKQGFVLEGEKMGSFKGDHDSILTLVVVIILLIFLFGLF
jgi:hypothetical protein